MVTLAKSPVIHTQDSDRRPLWERGITDTTQEGIRAGGHGQACRQACPGLAAKGGADLAVGALQPGRRAPVHGNDIREALGEDATRAVGGRTVETPSNKLHVASTPLCGKVGQVASV